MRHFVLLFLVVAAVGCQSKSDPAGRLEPVEPAAPAEPSQSAPVPAASTTPAAAPGEIGVAECDEYLKKWDACLATRITGDAREQVKVALDATRESWKRAAATPEGSAGLAAACRDAASVAGMQVAAYGCTW